VTRPAALPPTLMAPFVVVGAAPSVVVGDPPAGEVEPIALALKASKDLSAVGLTAKTIPWEQWPV